MRDCTYFAGKSLYGLGNGLGGLVIISAPVPCPPARGRGPFLPSISAALNLCGCLSLPVSIYRAIYIHRINAARLGGSRCGWWFLLLRV